MRWTLPPLALFLGYPFSINPLPCSQELQADADPPQNHSADFLTSIERACALHAHRSVNSAYFLTNASVGPLDAVSTLLHTHGLRR